MVNNKLNRTYVRKAFDYAIADIKEEYKMFSDNIDYVLIDTLYDLKKKFSANGIYEDRELFFHQKTFGYDEVVGATHLNTKEQRNLNKLLGLNKIETFKKYYRDE